MAEKVVSIITQAFIACTQFFETLVEGVPGAKTAIFWAVFVSMILSFLIVPIRGMGTGQGLDMATDGIISFTSNVIHNRKGKFSQSRENSGGKYERKGKYEKRKQGGHRASPKS